MRIVWSDDRHHQKCRLYDPDTKFPDRGSWWEARQNHERYVDDRIRCCICDRTWTM